MLQRRAPSALELKSLRLSDWSSFATQALGIMADEAAVGERHRPVSSARTTVPTARIHLRSHPSMPRCRAITEVGV